MASTKEYLDFVLEQLSELDEVSSRAMMGEYILYHLRHTFCTRFCENETNVKVIQSIMGHTSIETTMDINAEVTEMTKCE